jgi:hypothetical protein
MSRIRESPLAIRLYVAGFLLVVWAPVPFDHGDAPTGTFAGAFLLNLIPLVFPLGRSRVAWAFLLVVEFGALVFNLLAGPRWLVPFEVVLVTLLLTPSSRAFAWQRVEQEA